MTPATWTADNGDGTFTNPLFYDEFSDPDLIRVGDDFYLTGTTMHTMPGLPVLHSRDLVNWKLLGYAFDRLDLGPGFRLEDGREIYGQGIWAPCFRYHNGTFYIFSNINGQNTQVFRATNPAGPWSRSELEGSFHDLSVLFDDDGRVYMIWGYQNIQFAELTGDLRMVPGSQRTIITAEAGMGEGVHFYRFGGTYYIFSAWFAGRMRMPCARASAPAGPYEVNQAVSIDEDFGLAEGHRFVDMSGAPPYTLNPHNPNWHGRMSLHQGGIIDTPAGEWWGFSMMDYNSVGRLTSLSPVTWHEGWPYFGLPGNLGRTPRTWRKPNTGHSAPPAPVFQRNDSFAGPGLNPLWQWNHLPDDTRHSLAERPGWLRLHALPASDLWWARNSLTQRAIGPISAPSVELDTSGMQPGETAGLALLNRPYAWIGVRAGADGPRLVQFDQMTGDETSLPLPAPRLWLRAECDFLREQAVFSYSTDGDSFETFGAPFTMVFQLKTFQGIRYALFTYAADSASNGHADFRNFQVYEPFPRGLMQPIPHGERLRLATADGARVLAVRDGALVAVAASDPLASAPAARLHVQNAGMGRVLLATVAGYLLVDAAGQLQLVAEQPGEAGQFQWTETPYGQIVLLSLASQRVLRADPASGALAADAAGPAASRDDGASFTLLAE